MNEFNDIVDTEGLSPEETDRLRRVHELLVEAGPPPELSAALRSAPRPGEVRFLRQLTGARKVPLLAAAIIVLGVAFTAGFATGKTSTASAKPVETLVLNGTSAAPHAHATLDVLPSVGGNWPMTLRVSGLPRVAAPTYYIVWLVRDGNTVAPCGQFVVAKSGSSLTLELSAPYALKHGDTWVVTRQRYGKQTGSGVPRGGYRPHGRSTMVLRPATIA